MKHTQGEWKYEGGDNGSCEVDAVKTTIGLCRWDKNTGEYVISREEMEANAKLVAAAPEMLALLKEIDDCHDNYADNLGMSTKLFNKVFELIHKATS